MEILMVRELSSNFNGSAKKANDGTEYWCARDLQTILGYTKWDKFTNIIDKAIISCKMSGFEPSDHFLQVGKMINLPKGASREIQDYMLTRYACYLIAQNGDSSKEEIAFAQTYFAVQTRKQELIEERFAEIDRLKARKKLTETEKRFSEVLYEHGIDDQGFANVRSNGDKALFGGISTQEMKDKLGVPKGRPLADFLPAITITAKDLAAEITSFNVSKDSMHGESLITVEHVRNNRDVRDLLAKSNIKPEELPPGEDLKKVERRVNSETKKLHTSAKTQRLKQPQD